MIYEYRLVPRKTRGVEFLSIGSVYKLNGIEKTEFNNTYVVKEPIGAFTYHQHKLFDSVKIITNEYCGRKIRCQYNVVNTRDIYYISGYNPRDVIKSITLISDEVELEGDYENNCDIAILIKGEKNDG